MDLKPEELAQLSEKVEKGESLSEEERERIIGSLPGVKKTVDGLYSRAKTAEDDLKKLKENPPKQEQPPPAPPAETPEAKKDEFSIDGFLSLRKKGLSDEEIAEAVEEAKNLGVPIAKFAESKPFDSWTKEMRQKKQVAQATPAPSGRSLVVEKKSWEEMSPQERAQNIPKAFEQALNPGRKGNE